MKNTTVEGLSLEPVDVPAPRYRLAATFAVTTAIALSAAICGMLLTLGISPTDSGALSFSGGTDLRPGSDISIASTLDASDLWEDTTPSSVMTAPGSRIRWFERFESVTGTCTVDNSILELPGAFQGEGDESATYLYLGISSEDVASDYGMTFDGDRPMETVSFVTDRGRADYRAFASDQSVVVVAVTCDSDGDEAKALIDDVFLRTTVTASN